MLLMLTNVLRTWIQATFTSKLACNCCKVVSPQMECRIRTARPYRKTCIRRHTSLQPSTGHRVHNGQVLLHHHSKGHRAIRSIMTEATEWLQFSPARLVRQFPVVPCHLTTIVTAPDQVCLPRLALVVHLVAMLSGARHIQNHHGRKLHLDEAPHHLGLTVQLQAGTKVRRLQALRRNSNLIVLQTPTTALTHPLRHLQLSMDHLVSRRMVGWQVRVLNIAQFLKSDR